MNNQIIPLEKNKLLPVVEVFATLQGEGYHTGKAAIFVRLAGCDIGCNWCDSKASWNAALFPLRSADEILEEIAALPGKSVIVSGGEPLINNLEPLTLALKQRGYTTFLETAGAYPLTGAWDWICLSPKQQTPPLPNVFLLANELKVIIAKPEDLHWAVKVQNKVSPGCLRYLQPEWSARKQIIPVIVDFIQQNPSWMLSLQSHKYIGIP
jgi:7-carboxy-7-deazaguanine synthase